MRHRVLSPSCIWTSYLRQELYTNGCGANPVSSPLTVPLYEQLFEIAEGIALHVRMRYTWVALSINVLSGPIGCLCDRQRDSQSEPADSTAINHTRPPYPLALRL